MADNKEEVAANDSFLGGILKEVEENPVRLVYLGFTSVYAAMGTLFVFKHMQSSFALRALRSKQHQLVQNYMNRSQHKFK
jgi:hypothetical protein